MSDSCVTPAVDAPSKAVAVSSSKRQNGSRSVRQAAWLREPLLHFVVLGAVLFAVDREMVTRAGDPHVIVIGADVDKQARNVFKASRGRDPEPKELAALRQVWLDNEVLYREGLALQVDRGDSAIRERVIFKALSIVDANVQLPPPDDATLRRWFEKNRAKYDEPARFDFEEATPVGDSSGASVRAIVDALNANAGGDVKANLRVFKGRPESNLVLSYGTEFAATLQTSPATINWHAIPGKDGLHAIRLIAYTPAKPADFEALRGVIRSDWATATASEQRSAAVHALTAKYKVVFDRAPPGDVMTEPRDEDDEEVSKPPATVTERQQPVLLGAVAR